MTFELPPLPYAKDALAPYMSTATLDLHHGEHHRAYVANLNRLIEGTSLARESLEQIIRITATEKSKTQIFNNAAQAWNHDFFWRSMKSHGGGAPAGDLKARLDQGFHGVDRFLTEFKNAAETQFGSGWVWLLREHGKLKVVKTANADTPIAHNQAPLLACDIWEHAYYLDYQNRRMEFVRTFLDHLVNWDFVAENLSRHAHERAA